MATDKQQRPQHDHAHRAHHAEPASTDLADAIRDQRAADAASAHQRRGAGGGAHRRGDDPPHRGAAASNFHGRITSVTQDGAYARIKITAGQEHGIRLGMTGYVAVGHGVLGEFQIDRVDAGACEALADASAEILYGHHDAVINPSALPPPGRDLHGRIVDTAIEGPFTRLAIALGADRGVRRGMRGYMHAPDSDRPHTDFVVGTVHERFCYAHVRLPNLDETQRNPLVVINPTSGAEGAKGHGADKHHG